MVYRGVRTPVAWYREFLPCRALQADVYALYSFVPGALPRADRPLLREIAFGDAVLCAPQFADGHVSFSFELGQMCDVNGRWYTDSGALRGTVIGPLRSVGRTEPGDLPATIGAFFRPARVGAYLPVRIAELTDLSVGIDDVWGTAALRLPSELCDLDERRRIERLESVLLARLARFRQRGGSVDLDGLATSVIRRKGRVTVDGMARAAGVSRQHLSRQFRERIGIAPKLYARLIRCHSGLICAGRGSKIDWARAAIALGYADQSHMIAEFREFTGLTPHVLANRRWFHPFIERAKSTRWATGASSL